LHDTLTVRRETHVRQLNELTRRMRQLYSSQVSNNKEPSNLSGQQGKIDLLKTIGVFHTLEAKELETIAASSGWRSFGKGESVYSGEEGREPGNGRIYVVQQGEVLITKRGDEQRDINLATFVSGESFGELSLFERDTPDTSARCEEDTKLLVFPGESEPQRAAAQMEKLFEAYPRIKAKILRALLATVARRIRSTNRLIAEKSPWIQELRRQVMLDKLTGLYNAGYLEEEFPRILKLKAKGTCFLMIKPDNLKNLNDSYGHQAGDRTLQLMAAELRRQLGDRGIPIRYKGDVFSVILPGAGLETARELAEKIRRGMGEIDVSEVSFGSAEPRNDLGITVSIGIAGYPNGGGSAQRIIERAYENLFTARNRGGNRICSQQKK
jgi:diguanylate cyclase (GGDEF)-like protein